MKTFFINIHRLVTVFIFIVAACGQPQGSTDETFVNPEDVYSKNGRLDITLNPQEGKTLIGPEEYTVFTYNGKYTPPQLRLNPGDTLNLKLVNMLSMETNIHYHGFDVSPLGKSDNIFRVASPRATPGATIDYRVILPKDHNAGTYWYHPHPCGKSEQQVSLGMSGSIIVSGLFDILPADFANIKDRTFLLKDIQSTEGLQKVLLCDTKNGVQEVYDFDSNAPTTRTVNGVINPGLRIAPGETQLWRISNVGANIYYMLKLEGHKMYQVGEDASYLKQVVARDSILLAPAARVEVLVQGGPAGRYEFKTLAMSTGSEGDNYPEVTLATLFSTGTPVKPLPIPGMLNDKLIDYRTYHVTNRRTFTFTELSDGDSFYINGRQFNLDSIDTKVKLGSLEEWSLVNATNEMHVFHIHQLNFQVTQINGEAINFNHYNDVVNMPPQSTVKILLPFDKPYMVGKFVYHCHILAHEDRGMMQVIEVVK
jgi:suppressor of ftsI